MLKLPPSSACVLKVKADLNLPEAGLSASEYHGFSDPLKPRTFQLHGSDHTILGVLIFAHAILVNLWPYFPSESFHCGNL